MSEDTRTKAERDAEAKMTKAQREDAARQREDYARALREELEAVKAQGKKERASAIESELKRIGEKKWSRRVLRVLDKSIRLVAR